MTAQDVRDMEMSFSRGFTPGWLQGNDHKRLVPGTDSAKRGVVIGEVLATRGGRVTVRLDVPLRRGDGLAFDGDRVGGHQQGGRVYGLRVAGVEVESHPGEGAEVELEFGRDVIDTSKIELGARVWKNDDPALNRRLRRSFTSADPIRRTSITVTVSARAGEPLRIAGQVGEVIAEVVGEKPLEAARTRPATEASIAEQLGRLGGTPFELGNLQCELAGGPMVPASVLNAARRELVDQLLDRLSRPPQRQVSRTALDRLLVRRPPAVTVQPPALRVLCRNVDQVRTVTQLGIERVYVDFPDIRGYREAVEIARAAGVPIFIASVRIQKPGEQGLFKVLTRHDADGYLVRNLAALDYFRQLGKPIIGDFSLNVVNPLTADWLLARGCQQVTASYDLNRDQLMDLVDAMPADRLEVVIHQHMPMFHMEHCVFCSVLSPGTNKTNCGRPCDSHVVNLRDRVGMEHLLQADVACRNTLYNAVAQSGAEAVAGLMQRGVGSLRIELLQESASELAKTVAAYQDLIAGKLDGHQVWKLLQAANRVGVTRGTLEAARNPLAIL